MTSRLGWRPPGPDTARLATGIPAAARVLDPPLESRAAGLADAARRARRGDDPKAIHDVRVACRRLLASVWHRRDALGLERSPEVDRRLNRIRRGLGEAREREVTVAVLEMHLAELPTEDREALRSFLARRRRGVERLRRAVRPVVSARRVGRALAAVEREGRIAETGAVTARPDVEPERRGALLEGAAREWIERVVQSRDESSVHAARLAIKKWRYALECAAEFGDEHAAEWLAIARDLQQSAGALHDLATAEAFLARRERRWRSRNRFARAVAAERLRSTLAEKRTSAMAAFVARATSAVSSLPGRAGS